MNKITKLSLFTLLMLTVFTSAQGQATTATSTETSSFNQEYVSCGGEVVNVTGTIHFLGHFTISDSGHFSSDTHYIFILRGVGQTTGVEYVGKEAAHFTSNYDGNDVPADNAAPREQTETYSLTLNGRGKAPNERVKSLLHITVDNTGKVSSFKATLSADCN